MRKLLCILLSVCFFACAEKQEEAPVAPGEVLPEQAMVDVLMDLHIMEASITLNMIQDNRVLRDSSQYYNVYSAHHITKQQFDESFRYYASRPEKLNDIYAQVVAKLNEQQTAAMKKVPKDTVHPQLPSPPPIMHPGQKRK